MCYSVKVLLETQLKRATRHADERAKKEIQKKLEFFGPQDYYYVNAFDFPAILVYPGEDSENPMPAKWGLIPHWTKDRESMLSIRTKTFNARGETMFDKPSFRGPAQYRRCLLYVDGFYEYHHHKSKTYPYFVHQKNNQALVMGAIYDLWTDQQTGEIHPTFSIVTTAGNELLSKIHNNPKLQGPRMPLILKNETEEEIWLHEKDKSPVQKLIKPNNDIDLEAYTVQKLKGKNALGNVPAVSNKLHYKELEDEDLGDPDPNLKLF